MYDLNGDYLATYKSAADASRRTGICKRNILQVCSKSDNGKGYIKKSAGGRIWKFKGAEENDL